MHSAAGSARHRPLWRNFKGSWTPSLPSVQTPGSGWRAAASSFAVFFGGSLWDGLLAGVIAVLVFWMERCLAPFCMNGVEFQFIASFCCGISTLLFCRIGPQLHADKILIGIIMLLIPGIMLTNSIRDILLGDIISGSLRLVEAILMAAVLALGMMAAIWLMGGIA